MQSKDRKATLYSDIAKPTAMMSSVEGKLTDFPYANEYVMVQRHRRLDKEESKKLSDA